VAVGPGIVFVNVEVAVGAEVKVSVGPTGQPLMLLSIARVRSPALILPLLSKSPFWQSGTGWVPQLPVGLPPQKIMRAIMAVISEAAAVVSLLQSPGQRWA
jgi:hypothetical protein